MGNTRATIPTVGDYEQREGKEAVCMRHTAFIINLFVGI